MKGKKIIWLIVPLFLAACNGNASSESSESSSYSHPEGLATKLTRAIANLGKSFHCEGSLGYYYTDGTNESSSNYNVDIDVAEDGYYYTETNINADNPYKIENFFKTETGKFGWRTFDYISNEIVEKYSPSTDYDEYMARTITNLSVKKLKAIRNMQNWYQIQDNTIAKQFVYFLTGYNTLDESTYMLQVSQFALHFDGDNFDQFNFLLEYTDDEIETSVTTEQFKFILDVTDYGETEARKWEPFEDDETTKNLRQAFTKFYDYDNYTMHFDVDFASSAAEDVEFDYLVDIKNSYLYSTEVLTSTHTTTTTDSEGNEDVEVEYYNYNMAFKNKNNRAWVYWFDPETGKEVSDAKDFTNYWGFSSTITTSNLQPLVGAVDAACYKALGDNEFTNYELEDCSGEAIYALLPYLEWSSAYSADDFVVSVDDDYSLKITYSYTASVYVSGQSEKTKCTTTVTFKDYNTTTIPQCLIDAK